MKLQTAVILLFCVLSAAVALRLLGLSERSLWFDEASAFASIDRFGWTEMVERCARNVHPPFYYVVLRGWADVFGKSAVALRALSVVLAVVTIVAVYCFCRDGFSNAKDAASLERGRAAGVTAAALVAVSSYHIVWAQQMRMYMLGTALAALSTWMLLRALQNTPQTTRWWTGYVAAAAALAYTHNYGLFTVFGQGLYASGSLAWLHRGNLVEMARSSGCRRACGAFALVGLLYVPWLPVLLGQVGHVQDDYWIRPIHAWTVPNVWVELFFPRNASGSDSRWVPAMTSLALMATLAALLWRGGRGAWLTAAMVVVPVVCAVVVSLASVPIVASRYFLFAHLFALCALANVVCRVPLAELRYGLVALLIGNSLFIHWEHWQQLNIAGRPGMRALVGHVLESRHESEPVVSVHPNVYPILRYYTRGTLEPKLLAPSDSVPHYKGGPVLKPEDILLPDDLRELPAERMWVFDSTGHQSGLIRVRLPDEWRQVRGTKVSFPEVFRFQAEVSAALYQRAPSE